jgi:hypothetical protein
LALPTFYDTSKSKDEVDFLQQVMVDGKGSEAAQKIKKKMSIKQNQKEEEFDDGDKEYYFDCNVMENFNSMAPSSQ